MNVNTGLFDDDIGGPLTAPFDPDRVGYRIREMDAYCKEKGITASELTDEELKQFEIPLKRLS
jgi:hypothetical protein